MEILYLGNIFSILGRNLSIILLFIKLIFIHFMFL